MKSPVNIKSPAIVFGFPVVSQELSVVTAALQQERRRRCGKPGLGKATDG